MLELFDRDAGGRICKWSVGKYKICTPNIAIVINPNRMQVTPLELKKEFGAQIIITNSYIINKHENLRKSCLEKGLHKFLSWQGPIYTDSGAFQMYSQQIKGIDPKQIVEFQKEIDSDIITPLDVFTFPTDSKKVAKQKLLETTKRVKDARKKIKEKFLVGPIQGGLFLDLRKLACKQIAKTDPDLFAIGGIVPLMENYQFKELCDIILTCKQVLPLNKPVHAFGAGHPITFSLLTAVGCDLFDSAMYSIAAQRDNYLTAQGTHSLQELQEFPCNCPVCSKANPEEIKKLEKYEREKFLARHNLYVTFSELRTIRQAIRENCLWELVQTRCRAHPKLLEAFKFILKKYKRFFLSQGLVSKRSAFQWSGEESNYRPEVLRAKDWLKRVKSKKYFIKEPFGKIPVELSGIYPFSQSIIPDYKEKKPQKIEPKSIVRATLDYEFGKNASIGLKDFEVEISRKTGRIRRVYRNKELLGTIRARDGFFLPTVAAAKLLKKMKKVYIKDPEVVSFIKKGKSVFAKFVIKSDEIFPGEEVAVSDGKNIVAVGRALLNSEEIKQFKRGVVVKLRRMSKQI